MNSTMRNYIPFGLRGTVIGKTDEKVMVMFDEQFIGGQNLFGQVQNYRGAMMHPDHILNLTKKFESAQKKQDGAEKLINMFTEKEPGSVQATAQNEETKQQEVKTR